MKRTKTALWFVGLAAILAVPMQANGSSHREAPLITTMPKVDGTDFYMFNSYEPGRAGFVTIVADYQPLEDGFAGPNYYTMDPAAVYSVNIDNDGDAKPELTFEFKFTNTYKDLALPINGTNVTVPLVNIGPITAADTSKSNVIETYTVELIYGRKHGFLTNTVGGTNTFTKPTDNIGNKTFGSTAAYEAYADTFIYTVNIPGCTMPGKIFAGQRKDPFVVNLGETFDLLNISNPVGSPSQATDALAGKDVTSLELEVPAACLTASSTEPIIGGWTTASVPRVRALVAAPAPGRSVERGSAGVVQVSRLGMPLVNELVIGINDKDRFNSSLPQNDKQFLTYVTNPTVPTIIQTLFPSVTAPTLFPRTDLVATYLTGISGLNQPANVVPSEMTRLNTSTPVVAMGSQNRLGAIAGDLAGFPNGRRPGDDVVDITLDVAMGALIHAGTFGFGMPSQAPSGGMPFTDGALVNDSFFTDAFPYLKTPLPGSPNGAVPLNNGLPVNGAPSGGS